MKAILAAALVCATVGLTGAQAPQDRPWNPDRKVSLLGSLFLDPNEAYLKAERAEKRPDGGVSYHNVTITLGDIVITADEVSDEAYRRPGSNVDNYQLRLGDNVRLRLPVRD